MQCFYNTGSFVLDILKNSTNEITVNRVRIADIAGPSVPRETKINIAKVRVTERELYRITEFDNSVIIVIQLKMPPEIMPLTIMGAVILKNVLNLGLPRLMAASSTETGICCKMATLLRIV
jgi:hypothetical protein